MTLASRALLRGPDSCSRPADGRKQRCEFERTRGVRYRVAAMLVGESVFQSGMITSCLRRILGHGGNSRGYRCGRSGLSHSMDPQYDE